MDGLPPLWEGSKNMGTDVSKTVGSVLPGGFCFLHEVAGESEAGGGL